MKRGFHILIELRFNKFGDVLFLNFFLQYLKL